MHDTMMTHGQSPYNPLMNVPPQVHPRKSPTDMNRKLATPWQKSCQYISHVQQLTSRH